MSDNIAADEIARMQIEDVYTDEDLAECPETRRMMIDDSHQSIDDVVGPKLEAEAERLFAQAKQSGLELLEDAHEAVFVGGLSGIVMSHIRPRLRREVALQEPTESLAYLRAHFEKQQPTSRK